jgi:CxxC motif-containing protein (DUF1111 family)
MSHGDGLGPVYNATSCVACHNQGGTGGGGPSRRNVQILTPIAVGGANPDQQALRELATRVKSETGLPTSGSVVLHRFGTNRQYGEWRTTLLKKKFDFFILRPSQRNTPAIFGAGLIDAIPDEVIEAAAAKRFIEYPDVHGRVSRTPDGRVGRFGWKGHTASLRDFVLTACSVEVGLDVSGHRQSIDPSTPTRGTPRHDLSTEQCNALVDYLRQLPAPVESIGARPSESQEIARGADLFQFIGCAVCHRQKLGEVEGIYSDLLLHDMGQSLSDSAAYYGPDQEISDSPATIADASKPGSEPGKKPVPAGAQSLEWRTPPLWGLRDSAPYLHDGRARSMHEAIALHDGESRPSAQHYLNLNADEKRMVLAFLVSLSAPPAAPGVTLLDRSRLALEWNATESQTRRNTTRSRSGFDGS